MCSQFKNVEQFRVFSWCKRRASPSSADLICERKNEKSNLPRSILSCGHGPLLYYKYKSAARPSGLCGGGVVLLHLVTCGATHLFKCPWQLTAYPRISSVSFVHMEWVSFDRIRSANDVARWECLKQMNGALACESTIRSAVFLSFLSERAVFT